jgi:hypothetical protein
METAEQGIYAIGDIVAGLPQLAHSGIMAGAGFELLKARVLPWDASSAA